MKIRILFIVSFACAFCLADAFARPRGRPSRSQDKGRTLTLFQELVVDGPYIIEIDYDRPLKEVINGVPYTKRPKITDDAVEFAQGMKAERGKVTREIFLVRFKSRRANEFEPDIRELASKGPVEEVSDKLLVAKVQEAYPGARPGRPYELFSVAPVFASLDQGYSVLRIPSMVMEVVMERPHINYEEPPSLWQKFVVWTSGTKPLSELELYPAYREAMFEVTFDSCHSSGSRGVSVIASSAPEDWRAGLPISYRTDMRESGFDRAVFVR